MHPRRNAGSVVPGSPLEASVRILLHGTHWLIVDGHSGGAESVAAELRNVGCLVKLIDPEGRHVPQLGTFDAHVVLTDEHCDMRFLAERMSMSPGLRWASVLRMDWAELWTPGHDLPAVGVLAARAAPLLQPDARLRHLARTGPERFHPDLDELGPVRTLRAIATNDDVFRVSFVGKYQTARVELAGNLLLSATFQALDGPLVTGEAAFAGALEMEDARVSVERRARPEVLSLVSPLDEALDSALAAIRERREAEEGPTVRFSAPAPAPLMPALPAPPDAELHQAREARPTGDSALPTQALHSLRLPGDAMQAFALRMRLRAARLVEHLGQYVPRAPRAGGAVPRPFPRWVALSALGFISSLLLVLWVSRMVLLDGEGAPAAALAPAERVVRPEPAELRPPTGGTSERLPQAKKPALEPRTAKQARARSSHTEAPKAGSPSEVNEEDVADDPHALERLARRALKEGDTGRAVTFAARAVLLRKKRVAYRLLYGDALLADGQKDRALEQYRIALERHPDSREIRARIARLEMSPTS